MAILRSLNASTFAASYNDHCEVEIGDVTKAYFSPHIKVKKWGEVSGGLQFPTLKQISAIEQSSKQLTWASPSDQVQLAFDILDPGPQWEDGAIELHITLLKKPPTNKISLPFVVDNLEFAQFPLTEPSREIDKGIIWPENILGSYSFYHATRGMLNEAHPELGNIYKTGKAFHLFRVDAHDSGGKTIWCEMLIANNTLTLSLPQAWLDSAQYPVTIGETTFGFTTAGAADGSTSDGSVYWPVYGTPAGDGTLTRVNIWCRTGDSCDVQFGFYSNSGSAPSSRLAYDASAWTMSINAADHDVPSHDTFSYGITAGTQYWISSHSASGNHPGGGFCYDSGYSQTNYYRTADTTPPLSAGSVSSDYSSARFSVYATYTAGVGSTLTINVNDVLNATEALD